MNKRTVLNILISATVGAFIYFLYLQVEYFLLHGVFPKPYSFILLILLFAYLLSFIVCMPIVWIMRKIKIYNFLSVLVASTLLIGIIISVSENGIFWQHPEGFAVGFISGLVFLLFERRNASNVRHNK